jgi:hypothetical protein
MMSFNLKDRLEILFWKLARYIIVKEVGPRCLTKDTDDFNGEPFSEMCELKDRRCFACHAYETVDWIDKRIEHLEWLIDNGF